LNQMIHIKDSVPGYSARCFYGQGAFTIIASLPNIASETFNLTVAPTPARPPLPDTRLSIVSGNNQRVARINREIWNIGVALFQPLVVQVRDVNGKSLAGVLVDFKPGNTRPGGMTVKVHGSGAEPATIQSNAQGIATLAEFNGGHGVEAWGASGEFTIVAEVIGGGQTAFMLEVLP
ncbi:MAG: hypothetical protein ABIQ93_08920, partial [Saprospiraceae bacterium]